MTGDEIRVGRGSDNEIVLPDYSVSRKHAALRRDEGGWFVEDLMSTNGIQVNRRSVKRSPVKPGDRLKFGIFEFVVEGHEPPREPTASVLTDDSGRLSSATIVRRLSDFSADYGLTARDDQPSSGLESGVRSAKREALDQAYANRIFGFLTRLGRLLSKGDSVDEILERVMTIAFEALPVDRGFIMLTDEKSGQTVCALARSGEDMEFRPRSKVPVSDTILETVMRERVALLTYDAQSDQRLAGGDSIRIHQIRSAMCAPLWSGENIIGMMQVDSPFHAGTFTESDLDLFTALANFAAVAVERIRNARKVEVERQVRARLERYHSPAVIEEVLSENEETASGGMHRMRAAEVTVLFADVVGFTQASEQLPPGEVADILNGYFSHAVSAIFAEEGTLDKYIGDCVMAFFGAPVPHADHADRAVRAAIELQKGLYRWNQERLAGGQEPVQCRVAINTGPVVVGDIGTDRRVDYTVLGNTVNVAARLEGYVAEPGEIVIGQSTQRALGGQYALDELGPHQLRGLQQAVACFRVQWL